jgi:hypothetical protein
MSSPPSPGCSKLRRLLRVMCGYCCEGCATAAGAGPGGRVTPPPGCGGDRSAPPPLPELSSSEFDPPAGSRAGVWPAVPPGAAAEVNSGDPRPLETRAGLAGIRLGSGLGSGGETLRGTRAMGAGASVPPTVTSIASRSGSAGHAAAAAVDAVSQAEAVPSMEAGGGRAKAAEAEVLLMAPAAACGAGGSTVGSTGHGNCSSSLLGDSREAGTAVSAPLLAAHGGSGGNGGRSSVWRSEAACRPGEEAAAAAAMPKAGREPTCRGAAAASVDRLSPASLHSSGAGVTPGGRVSMGLRRTRGSPSWASVIYGVALGMEGRGCGGSGRRRNEEGTARARRPWEAAVAAWEDSAAEQAAETIAWISLAVDGG